MGQDMGLLGINWNGLPEFVISSAEIAYIVSLLFVVRVSN